MNFIYFLFSLLKNVVPFQNEAERVALQDEMTEKFNQLETKDGILKIIHSALSSVWARFGFVVLFVPLQRKLQEFVFPQTPPMPDYEDDLEDYEEDEQDA